MIGCPHVGTPAGYGLIGCPMRGALTKASSEMVSEKALVSAYMTWRASLT